MHTDRNDKSRIYRLVPDSETILISALVFGCALYGRYHRISYLDIWFGLVLIGWALFSLPKIYFLLEYGSKGWGLHDVDNVFLGGFKNLYKLGYVLMGLGTLGLILGLLT